MKVAFISLIAYDDLNRDVLQTHKDDADYFDEKVISKHNDPVHKWCKILLDQGIDIELWYLAYHAKGVKCFRHKFGHLMRRIHAFDSRSFLTHYLAAPWSFRLLRELKKNHITHVLLLNYLLNRRLPIDMADLTIGYCRRKRINVLPIFGGGTIEDYGFLKKKIKAACLQKTDAFLCQSQAELDVMIGRHSFPREKAILFSNPLDIEKFQPLEHLKAVRAVSLAEDRRYLLFIGRLVPTKGVGHLLNIMPELVRKFPDLVLLIIGSGPAETAWKQLVFDFGLEKHVRFLGFVDNEQLHYYYNTAEALVLPSYSEGVPNIILEAIACDTPVIASAVGGIPHILSDEMGILVPVRDEAALSLAIERVLNKKFMLNPEKRHKLLSEINMKAKGKELAEILSKL